MKGLFLGVSGWTAVHVLGDVEQIALDPRTRRGLGAMAWVAVVALVVLVLCCISFSQCSRIRGTSHKLSRSLLRTSVSLPLAAATSSAASSTISPVVSVVATIVVGHRG
jgi:putative effector of murein hydrolase